MQIKSVYLTIFVSALFSFCTQAQDAPAALQKPLHAVGDILFDSLLDDPGFSICQPGYVLQYYNTASYYKNHKDSISRYLREQYQPPAGDNAGQSGYITIKFIISCKGLTGRFRVYEMDSSYQAFQFSKAISGQLLALVKAINSWEPAAYKGLVYDSYQYICFRIRKGRLLTISP